MENADATFVKNEQKDIWMLSQWNRAAVLNVMTLYDTY